MAKDGPIWMRTLWFLEDCSVARVARSCRTLSLIARDELRQRTRRYLISGNPWEHAFYPVQGYYGRRFDGDGNEIDSGEGIWWARCLCKHHENLYKGYYCSCGVCFIRAFGPNWVGVITVQGVQYRRQNEKSGVECSNLATFGEQDLEVHWELKTSSNV